MKISVIGLGYVGLPLALEFSKKYSVVGYDLKKERISQLINGVDNTFEVDSSFLKKQLKNNNNLKKGLFLSNNKESISDSNSYIIAVDTPVDEKKQLDLNSLKNASELVGSFLKKGDTVIYESTVYPGATEEFCNPILEKISNLKLNYDYYLGYSPERINPGDKSRSLTDIKKITSGSCRDCEMIIDKLYSSIIVAGTYLAPSIKVAEAAKVIENSQRDVNIAFVNELAKIFNLLEIDTSEVLKAAQTKWNFLPFNPGLVGGHCIGVDPYYLATIAKKNGYSPELILSARKLNDSMGKYVASQVIKLMIKNDINIKNSEVLILGISYKENCPDIRNTKVVDIFKELFEHSCNITVYDPLANPFDVQKEYGIDILKNCPQNKYDVIILAVAHDEFIKIDLEKLKKMNSIIYDVKNVLGNKSDYKL